MQALVETAYSRAPRGRACGSGRQVIDDAAATILKKAEKVRNRAAKRAGLRHYRKGKGIGRNGEGGWSAEEAVNGCGGAGWRTESFWVHGVLYYLDAS